MIGAWLIDPAAAGGLSAVLARRNAAGFAERAAAQNVAAQKARPKIFQQHRGVAVIPVYGMLLPRLDCVDPIDGMTGYDGIQAKLAAAVVDPTVKAVALLLDSPGGSAAGAAETAEVVALVAEEKPVAAILSSHALSAAYWLAAPAGHIVGPAVGSCGSIGAIQYVADETEAMAKNGVKILVFRSGAEKADGGPMEPLSEAAAARIHDEINWLGGYFTDQVAAYRRGRVTAQTLAGLQGRSLLNGQGVEVGLIDELASPRMAFANLAVQAA